MTKGWNELAEDTMSKCFIADTRLAQTDLELAKSEGGLVGRVSWDIKKLNDFIQVELGFK